MLNGKACRFPHEAQMGIYCQSTAPQHICQVNHRPLRRAVPEACVFLCDDEGVKERG